MTKGGEAGIGIAEGIIKMIHLMYQKDTATRVLKAMIKRLTEGLEEFKR